MAFLQRHYSLHFPIWQPTAIVVFPSIFEDLAPEKPQQSRAAQAAALASDGGTNTADAVDDDAHDADWRPLTALERNRRSINQSYNGTTPPRVGSGRKAVALAQEMAQTHVSEKLIDLKPKNGIFYLISQSTAFFGFLNYEIYHFLF